LRSSTKRARSGCARRRFSIASRVAAGFACDGHSRAQTRTSGLGVRWTPLAAAPPLARLYRRRQPPATGWSAAVQIPAGPAGGSAPARPLPALARPPPADSSAGAPLEPCADLLSPHPEDPFPSEWVLRMRARGVSKRTLTASRAIEPSNWVGSRSGLEFSSFGRSGKPEAGYAFRTDMPFIQTAQASRAAFRLE